ncbi:hypothetical protein OE88DRAFT_522920 [Heliocybe sulcata]|uniref:BTB domain-containing protein n=1 Tax=Heliocybe sulcata TaxID=5364 RepID=A0A5C3MW68_9AGAM|nr:hypothetical protein OE88DRAFT_522920 [Heliocybe sulcata]
MTSKKTSDWRPTESLFQEDPTADVVLRSRDGVDFRAHMHILSIASHLFRDMFSLGKASDPAPERKDVLSLEDRVVPMTEETAEVVEKLLQLCYPVDQPTWDNAGQIHPVLAAAKKYQMETIVRRLMKELMTPRFLEKESLRIFAIACHLKLNDSAQVAARHTLSHPIQMKHARKELQFISGLSVLGLFEFRQECSKAAATLATDPGCIDVVRGEGNWALFKCSDTTCHPVYRSQAYSRECPQWWYTYLSSAHAALTEKPSGTSAMTDETLKPALEEASRCNRCCSSAYLDLARFGRLLGVIVERTVEKITKTYDFCEA